MKPLRKPISTRGASILCVHNAGIPILSDSPKAFLCWTEATGRYYIHPTKPRKYLGRDLQEAVFRFRQWVEGQRENEPRIAYTRPRTEAAVDTVHQFFPHVEVAPERTYTFSESEALKYVRDLILTDSKEAARKLQIKEIAHIHSLPTPEPSLSLDAVLEMYVNRRKALTDDEKKKSKNAWSKFKKAVGVKTLEEIDKRNFAHFASYIDRKLSSVWGSRTTRNMLNKLITILNFASDRNEDKKNADKVVGLLRVLKSELPENDSEATPKAFSKDDWTKLFNAAKGTQWEPMLLLGLNACFYGCDIRRVPVAAFNFEERTLSFKREKTGNYRVAILWDMTIETLKNWLAKNPSETTVFKSELDTPYTDQGLRNSFRRFRKAHGFDDKVTFDRIRDSAYTRAIQGGATETEAKLLAGHALSGESDSYVERNPMMVAKACEAVKAFYFGEKK